MNNCVFKLSEFCLLFSETGSGQELGQTWDVQSGLLTSTKKAQWDTAGWGHSTRLDSFTIYQVKEFACNAGDLGLIHGLGRSPGEGDSYPLQYSCLENFMDRRAWKATVHGVAKSWTWLSDFHFHTSFPKMFSAFNKMHISSYIY